MCRRPGRQPFRLSTPSHHSDKFDPVSVLKRVPGPLLPRKSLAVELDQQSARIQATTRCEFPQGRCGGYLACAAVDENA